MESSLVELRETGGSEESPELGLSGSTPLEQPAIAVESMTGSETAEVT